MASNNKRREATRRQLEEQLRERQVREARRKRAVLIGSITGSIVVIAVIVVLVLTLGGGSSKKTPSAAGKTSPTPSPTAATTSATPSSDPTDTPCKVTHPKGSVTVDKVVTIANPTNLTKTPDASSCSKTVPTTFAYKDLVVGKGKPATAKSTVSVQYEGIFYSDGYQFNSSWRDNAAKPATFSLAGGTITGFADGIAGSGKVPPMRVGGRRVLVLPAALAYGSSGSSDGSIPANTPLVFVVDLTAVK